MSGQLKVLHIIGGGEFGGAEQHVLTLLRFIDRQRVDARLACLFAAPLAVEARREGIPTEVFVMRGKLDFSQVADIASYLKKEQIEIVHTHGVRANLIGRLAAGIAHTPHVVTTVHSVLALDYPRRPDRWINRFCEWITGRWTEKFIAVSGGLARELISGGLPANKVVVIHNGLDLRRFRRGDGAKIRAEFGLGGEQPLVGVVARMHPVKGHEAFLKAALQVSAEFPQARFFIVGCGHHRPALEALVDALGLREAVIFTGFRQDVEDILAALDLLVVPSLSEGFGLTAVEAMALGKPVLATRVGGLPEIIDSGQNGLLALPGDPDALANGMLFLLNNPDGAARMAAAGRHTAEEKFSAGFMAEQTTALYQELCRG